MRLCRHRKLIGLPIIFGLAVLHLTGADAPKTWIDTDTGHRVVQLTSEPGSASLYFNQNAYTPDGRSLIFTTPDGVSVLDLASRFIKPIVKGNVRVIVAGAKTRHVFYIKDGGLCSADIDTGEERQIGKLPARGSISTVNADESLAAGTYTEGNDNRPQNTNDRQAHALEQPKSKGQMMEARLAAHIPMAMFVMDMKTGEVKVIHRSTEWLNHLQFSPTDPALMLFCHEGPWHKVDRIWTIRTDGSNVQKVHTRTMEMEIAGHEFWSADGSTIWYDLQTPRGEDFWVAGYQVKTGERTWYHLQRDEWSIHFNVSNDGKLFAGDGGDDGQVAHAKDGRWIYLFRPQLVENRGGMQSKNFVRAAVFHSERLVNMSKHGYKLEPNVSFTPDGKWVIFRSNMFGPTYVFAVEVAKASGSKAD